MCGEATRNAGACLSQSVAACCNMLQCVAACCSVLQCVAVFCHIGGRSVSRNSY